MFFTDKSALAEISGSTFSKPPTSYDALTGYRWNTGTVRFVRVIHGELIVDNLVRFNNYGHHASYDYVPQKPSARAFRFVVLGDSFTNDQAVSTGWPERLQELLRSRPETGRSVEVYEFSTDGGGLLNWYATFRDQLLPNFEFDALIIADWGNDLERQFAISHSTPQGHALRDAGGVQATQDPSHLRPDAHARRHPAHWQGAGSALPSGPE